MPLHEARPPARSACSPTATATKFRSIRSASFDGGLRRTACEPDRGDRPIQNQEGTVVLGRRPANPREDFVRTPAGRTNTCDVIFEGGHTHAVSGRALYAHRKEQPRTFVAANRAKIISTPVAERAKWRLDTKKLSRSVNQKTEGVMRGSVAGIALASATVTLCAPGNALSGPIPGAKLKNAVPSNVEPVVVFRAVVLSRAARAAGWLPRTRGRGWSSGSSWRCCRCSAGVRPGHRAVMPWVRFDRWGLGGAIAAGAAIGFCRSRYRRAWAGAPPAPEATCLVSYTDRSRTQGVGDVCR